jgi:transposase
VIADRCGYWEHSDVNAAKNIRNNLISTAAKQKVEQAVETSLMFHCQSAKCVDSKIVSDTSLGACTRGN